MRMQVHSVFNDDDDGPTNDRFLRISFTRWLSIPRHNNVMMASQLTDKFVPNHYIFRCNLMNR